MVRRFSLPLSLSLLSVGASLLALVSGCVVENDPSPSRQQGSTVSPAPTATGSTGGSTGTGGTGGTGGSVAPMLVDVDTNQTMSATPGDGVGVFVEYKAGGSWHVWWTCDTNKSQQSCNFSVKLSASAPLSNVVTTGSAQASTATPGITTFTTNTSSAIDGVTFDTVAGDVLTLDAAVDGIADGSFVFFVQSGKVNGGYTGKLTNPLKLEGKTP
jgi:hypothetical protein